MAKCQYAIDSLPAYTPQLITFFIVLVEFIIVVIAYIARETQRKKVFFFFKMKIPFSTNEIVEENEISLRNLKQEDYYYYFSIKLSYFTDHTMRIERKNSEY